MVKLKQMRTDVILARPELVPLSTLVEAACSDDETDTEATGPARRKPRIVRKLEWRSKELAHVCHSLDLYKEKMDQSSPNRISGAPPRPRIRTSQPPRSRVKPPARLPVDCYDSFWYSSLEPDKRDELQAHPVPALARLMPIIDNL